MQPWERRLRDLARLLSNCGETYFAPDLFRQNTNQFLQTSRTVTFIIQKNKASIVDYETWYQENVLKPWARDTVMNWARDARNIIEKEGDLEMNSYLSAAVVFSHLPSEDVIIEMPRPFLVQGDISKIAKLAKANLPTGVWDAAVLMIERRWVTTSLEKHELIFALTYVYSRLYRMCADLSRHLGGQLDGSIPHPSDLDPVSNDVAHTRFIKLGKPNISRLTTTRVHQCPDFKPPASFSSLNESLASLSAPQSLDDLVERAAKMAEYTFNHHGSHVPMLFFFDDNWKPIDFLSTAFADQADKFLFWRNAAKRAVYLRAAAFIWVSEAWVRKLTVDAHLPIRKLPIVGERLQLIGGAVNAETRMIEWSIVRTPTSKIGTLEPVAVNIDEKERSRIFFVEPLLDAMRLVRANEKS